jgi:hypothetical protein
VIELLKKIFEVWRNLTEDKWNLKRFINNHGDSYKGNDKDIIKFIKDKVVKSKQPQISLTKQSVGEVH